MQETKAFREIPRLPKKRTVTENVCAKPPSSSFPEGLVQLTLKEKERIKRARNISPSCPTLQSPTALLHPKQQAEMQNHAICDLQKQSSVFAWVGERDSQAYHQLEKMQNRNALVAFKNFFLFNSFFSVCASLNYFSSQEIQILNEASLHITIEIEP